MRTTYKTLRNILEKNFSIESFERNTRAQGHLVIFENHNNENWVDNLRIVLVDGNSYEREQGIHLRRIETKVELERALVDAVETAHKDLFTCIYIHQSPKPSVETKARQIKAVQGWIDSDRNREIGRGVNTLPIDPATTLESMDSNQLALVLKLISGAFQSGATSTREFWSPKYHAFRKELERRGATMNEILELSNVGRGA